MAQTVIGIFDSSSEAQNAVQTLMNNGFSRDNVDISVQNNTGTTTDSTSNNYKRDRDGDGDHDMGDSISNFFSSLFGSDDDDSYNNYAEVARRGSVVTVHALSADEAQRAADILDDCGAVDVDDRAQQYRTGTTGTMNTNATGTMNTGTMNTGATANNLNTGTTTNYTDTDRTYTDTDRTDNFADRDRTRSDVEGTTSIPIIEENLQVGKRETQTGGVRVRSRIVERPIEENLRLRQEHVTIERNPVNRPATDADLGAFREGTIEMTEHAEVPVVNKEARIVEEVTLGKNVEEREEVVRDTVRKTEVDVENLTGDANVRTDVNNTYTNDDDVTRRRDTDNDRDGSVL